MRLTEYLEVIAYDIAFWLTAFQNTEFPLEQLGDVCMEVTGKLRTAAIIALLGSANSNAFFHNLMRSARCRVQYLQRLRDAGRTDDHHQVSSRVDPFLDAVAAEDYGAARTISSLSPSAWSQDHEYEDDYCYAQILHGLISGPRTPDGLDPLFERYERVLAGEADARLDVTRALAHKDRAAFDLAFESLLARRTRQIDADKARHRMEDPYVIAERTVYVEGLALLRIAARLGLRIQYEYLYCPSIALSHLTVPFPGE
jgi:Immunity protein 49